MRITKDQEIILDSLVCERLKDNPNSPTLIQNFENEKGTLIVEYLKQRGLEEDKEGNTAFYIVRTQENEVLMFFSLKCGELFDPLFDVDAMEAGIEEYLVILQALKNADEDSDAQKLALTKLKEMSETKGISLRSTLNQIFNEIKHKKKLLSAFNAEKDTESNVNIARVSKTYPGVELVHFCTNENAKKTWKLFGLSHSMGEVIFWKFIAPKFFEVQRIVGCEYAFLFAADLSEDRTLMNYYNVSLKFDADMKMGTNKPFYDFACAFMCQSLTSLRENQQSYFENFNIDELDEIV